VVCFSFSDGQSLCRPLAQCFSVLKNVYRHFIVLHHLWFVRKGFEWSGAGGFVVGAVGIVNLEIEDIIRNQGEEQALAIDSG
jgi:hypothetical protein